MLFVIKNKLHLAQNKLFMTTGQHKKKKYS